MHSSQNSESGSTKDSLALLIVAEEACATIGIQIVALRFLWSKCRLNMQQTKSKANETVTLQQSEPPIGLAAQDSNVFS